MTPKPTVVLKDNGDVKLDLEAVFMDPRAQAFRELRRMAEERERRKEEADVSQKLCPECGAACTYLAECPVCGADVRNRCPDCGLPYAGQGDLCKCGTPTEEEREHFRATAPPKSANRGNGGMGHGPYQLRRKNSGY